MRLKKMKIKKLKEPIKTENVTFETAKVTKVTSTLPIRKIQNAITGKEKITNAITKEVIYNPVEVETKNFVEQNKKEWNEWENSIEGIWENITIWGEINIQDEKDRFLIVKTLQKLPKDVREKVLDKVIFVIMRSAGTVMNARFSRFVRDGEIKKINSNMAIAFEQPLIFLNFSEMKKGREMDTIAHEIAHFILNHHINYNNPNNERKADDLTEKWGFKRGYKDYKQFEKNERKS